MGLHLLHPSSGRVALLVRQAASYGAIGVLSAGLDAALFQLLTAALGWRPWLANPVSVHLGILTSFLLNRRFTFARRDRTARRLLRFYAVGLLGLALSQAVLWAGLALGLAPLAAKLPGICLAAAVQFGLNRRVTFGPAQEEDRNG